MDYKVKPTFNGGPLVGDVGVFGDGSAGSVTLGPGTTSLGGLMFYQTLTIPNGATLRPNSYPLFAWLLDIQLGGALQLDGGDGAAGGAGGLGSTLNVLGNGGAGGNGNVGSGGGGQALSNSFGGSGGSGGNTGSSNAGTTTAPARGNLRALPYAAIGYVVGASGWVQVNGGGGGGGGSGDGTTAGAGGGGGGGVLIVCAREIIINGILRSKGGNGGTPTAGNRGGGGGGGGGLIVVVYAAKSGANQALSSVANTPGGNPGANSGTATPAPVAGSHGTLIELVAA